MKRLTTLLTTLVLANCKPTSGKSGVLGTV